MIKNVNTIEDYRNMDKPQMILQAGKTVWPVEDLHPDRYQMTSADQLTHCYIDLGRHQRRHHLFLSFFAIIIHHPLLCRSQKIQVLLLVRVPCHSL
jgi:hypothetical protein